MEHAFSVNLDNYLMPQEDPVLERFLLQFNQLLLQLQQWIHHLKVLILQILNQQILSLLQLSLNLVVPQEKYCWRMDHVPIAQTSLGHKKTLQNATQIHAWVIK